MRKNNFKKISVFSLSLLLGGISAIAPVSALEILANNYTMDATASNMSAQDLCRSAGLVHTDPTENVTWRCSSGNLNTTVAGRYSINITATDNGSGESKVKTIQVRVKSVKTNSAPVLKLSASSISMQKGGSINLRDYIAQATDAEDGNLAGSVAISGSVNTGKPGTYTIRYSVKDSQGLTATQSLVVTVQDTPASNSSNGGTSTGGSSAAPVVTSGGNSDGGTSTVTRGSYSSGATLPDTADNTAYILGGAAMLAIGSLAVVSKRKKEIAE